MWPSDAQINEEKRAFVRAWLKISDPFKAAVAVFGPLQASKCLKVADEWPKDSLVLALKEELLEENGEEAFLPSKAELARRVIDTADGFIQVENKLKALRLYAEVMGFIAKPENDNGPKGAGVVAVTLTPNEAKL
jgi:hypothetical protein